MKYTHNKSIFNFKRYPATTNKSLLPWSAADEHILKYIDETELKLDRPLIINDRFGVLACLLHPSKPKVLINYKSQDKSIYRNVVNNSLTKHDRNYTFDIEKLKENPSQVVIKIPKSMELFRLYLNKLTKKLGEDAIVLCSFMTRNFTQQMVEIAESYFETVEQSRAWKKSRLMILKSPKSPVEETLINELEYKGKTYKQYFGVFSGNNIDFATQFLLENFKAVPGEKTILDVGCGNGIIASTIFSDNPESDIHLLDDSYLAIESAKMNLYGEKIHFHFNDGLEIFDDEFFDLIVSNPPFHFEFENNIEVSIGLFEEAHRKLKKEGRFVVVSSKHLNYLTHLEKLFPLTKVVNENDKFIIYECKR